MVDLPPRSEAASLLHQKTEERGRTPPGLQELEHLEEMKKYYRNFFFLRAQVAIREDRWFRGQGRKRQDRTLLSDGCAISHEEAEHVVGEFALLGWVAFAVPRDPANPLEGLLIYLRDPTVDDDGLL